MLTGSKGSEDKGKSAEDSARAYLEQRGLRMVAANFQCRLGEIDLVMLHHDCLVFVEVRYRKHAGFGGGEESVTVHKQRRLIRTAQYFLQQHPRWSNHACRFDVLAVYPPDAAARMLWIQDAFQSPTW